MIAALPAGKTARSAVLLAAGMVFDPGNFMRALIAVVAFVAIRRRQVPAASPAPRSRLTVIAVEARVRLYRR